MNLTPVSLRAHIAVAARTITPTWSLDSFIAVNPLSRYENLLFGEDPALPPGTRFTRPEDDYLDAHHKGDISTSALRAAIAEMIPEIAGTPDITVDGHTMTAIDVAVTDLLNKHVTNPDVFDPSENGGSLVSVVDDVAAHWLARLLGSPQWATAAGDEDLYRVFRRLAAHDWLLPHACRHRLRGLPHTAEETILHVLATGQITGNDLAGVLENQLGALSGWTSHIVHHARSHPQATLTEYLGIRFALHHALDYPLPTSRVGHRPDRRDLVRDAITLSRECFGGNPDGRGPVSRVLMFLNAQVRPLVWQKAAEIHYRSTLIRILDAPQPVDKATSAQFVFCIDTRSEGIRRHLESDQQIDTFGFAGFFATPLHFRPLHATASRDHYPALLSAGMPTTETAADELQSSRRKRGLLLDAAVTGSSDKAAHLPVAAFSWAETAGWLTGAAAAARTLAPTFTRRWGQALGSLFTPQIDTRIVLPDRFTVEEQTDLAEAALRMMGLTDFAPLVIFTGHRSTTQNNLFQAVLDCGACGGNGGAPNARAAAAIFNNPHVRAALIDRGLPIPATTRFVAAEHDTTTDSLTILDADVIPDPHHMALQQLAHSITAASDALTRERAGSLPGTSHRSRTHKIRARAHDWAEMYPELGLAGNAALLIGPRQISRGSNLHRRVFLHSYDSAADPEGTALEAIMTAPLLVAQWINHQYYFSTINPDTLGAGNKTLHNPIQNLGVLAGHGGDLRIGLPWQSVAAGTHLLHNPLRLSVLIQAPLDHISRIIATTDTLRNLLDNQWINLHARPDSSTEWRQYNRYGFAPIVRTSR